MEATCFVTFKVLQVRISDVDVLWPLGHAGGHGVKSASDWVAIAGAKTKGKWGGVGARDFVGQWGGEYRSTNGDDGKIYEQRAW